MVLYLQSAERAALLLRRGFSRAGAADGLDGASAHLGTYKTQTITLPHHYNDDEKRCPHSVCLSSG